MKFSKILTVVLGLGALMLSMPAQAQFDTFNVPRTLLLSAPQNIGVNGGTGLITNGPIDHVNFDGTAVVDVFVETNSGTTGGTLTAQLFNSDDRTNLTAMTGIALINSTTTFLITNYLYGGSGTLTNNNLAYLPGTITTPTVYSAGYATPYLAPLQFTNAGAITVSTAGNYKFGFQISHAKRYIYIVWNAGGTVTNFTTGSTLTATPINSSTD